MTTETNEVRGQSLDCARDWLRADDAGKWDTIVPRQSVQMCDGRLSFGGREQPLTPSGWATGQLCARLGIPAPYFRKCPTDLQDEQANYWLEHGPQKQGETWLLRAKDENLRAVLSERYSPLDNATLLDELRMLLPDSYRVDWFGLQDESLHLRVVDPSRTRELLPDDALTVGIHLVNSEVGLRSVTVDAMVFRLVCTNGLIRLVKGKSLLRQRHLHVSHHRFIGALGEAIDNALKESEGFLNQLAATTQTPVPDISDVMDKIAEKWNLSDETQQSAKLALRQENASQQESLYGLVNAYTSAAQKLPDSGRYDLEVLAGNLAQHGVSAFAPHRSSASPRLSKQSESRNDEGDEPFDVVETAREMFEAQVMSRSSPQGSGAVMTQTQEHSVAVQTAEMTWSATRLKSYLTCPRQFRYSYVDGIASIPTSPLVFGRALHDALCFVHERQMQSGSLPPVGDVLEHFDALWSEALKADPFFRDGSPSPAQHLTTGHEILRAYLAAPENQKLPLAAELAFEVKAGDYRLAGIVDRLDESEGGLIVVDFKSGTRKPSLKDLDEELQFTIYAFTIEQMMGRPVEKVVHCHLRTGDCFDAHRTDDQFAWLLDEVLPFVAGGVARGEFAPRSGYWCNWCDYRELCRAENARDAGDVM